MDRLIVDGYNVLNYWSMLVEIKKLNLAHARDKLIDVLCGYGVYKGYKVILVFDAHEVVGSEGDQDNQGVIDVVYTKEGETADSYIEKLVYSMMRQEDKVYVVTSDWAEQLVVLWAGAYRISARELILDFTRVKGLIEKNFSVSAMNNSRHELENRISFDVLVRLEEMRRGR